ncbi:hypothetical protein [Streptococcus oricebi]|uniref:hypothetical protein n=1 Tax=Streptococcus oricebi TaxID=1547447 RepID=UPI001AE6B62D|nr:hypothetical protein [Streptococcus oricebi]
MEKFKVFVLVLLGVAILIAGLPVLVKSSHIQKYEKRVEKKIQLLKTNKYLDIKHKS